MPTSDVLVGWQQIADFLQVHQDTAKKYYKECGLPVYKHSRVAWPISSKPAILEWISLRANDGSRKTPI